MAQENEIILKLKLQEAGFKVGIKKLKEDLKTVGNFSDEYKLKVAKLNLEEQKLINTRKKLSQATDQLIGNNKQGLNGVSKASGSATAAAMELGRVVSDAPYGIRGMANNVSQLASQLFFMAGQQETATVATKSSTVATTTDTVAKGANTTATVVATGATVGFTGAVKMMWSALMGPMGVLLAIQAVIAGLDYFYGANKKAEKGVNEFNDSVAKSASNLKILKRANDSGTMSMEETAIVVKKANSEYKDLNIQVDKNGKITDESVLAINRKIKALENLAKATAMQTLISREFVKIDPLQEKLKVQEAEALVKLKVKGINTIKEAQDIADNSKDYALKGYTNGVLVQVNSTKDQIDSIQENIDRLMGKIPNIGDLFKGNDPKGKTKLLEIKDFDKQVEDYLSQIASVSEKEEILNAKLKSDKILIQEEYHLKNLDLKNIENKAKFKQQSDAYRVEYEAFLKQEVLLTHLTQAEADAKLDKFDADAKAEQDKSDDNYKILLKKWNDYYTDKLFIALSGEMKVEEVDKASNAKKLDNIAVFIEQYKALMSGLTDFIDGEFERELTIEQNKTNVLNAELNNRLNNENLSKEQRKSIQNQIAQNDEKLRVKQEAIARKQFKVTKAFNIAMTIADTYMAAQKAYLSQMQLTPDSPFRAKIAAGIAVASGLAKVAAISRTTFKSTSPSTPTNIGGGGSSSGGGTDRAEPSFNIVGRSQDNILLSAIQSQFDKPLKAYVVARDVTNQQQLDGVISTAAST